MSNSSQQLWCAVIEQALIDATQPLSKRRSVRMDQLRTREWFTLRNRDFEEVCALAGIEADRVRAVATSQIEAARKRDPNLTSHRGVDRNLQKRPRDRGYPPAQATRQTVFPS